MRTSQPSQTYDSDVVLKKMLEDIGNRIQSDSLQPDFIIVSGDIAFSSKPGEYVLAGKFLDKLLDISRLAKDNIFIVPGNHDINRGAITPAASAMARGINGRDSTNGILTNDVDRAFILKRFSNYQNFINEYFGKDILSFDNAILFQ